MMDFSKKILSFLLNYKQLKLERPIDIIIPLIGMLIYVIVFQFCFNRSFSPIFDLPNLSFFKSFWAMVFVVNIKVFLGIGLVEEYQDQDKKIDANTFKSNRIGISLVFIVIYFLLYATIFQFCFNETIAYLFELSEISLMRSLETIICLFIITNILKKY
ncbi:MAG: hypothetical protein ABEI32_16950 [Halothece sp.]